MVSSMRDWSKSLIEEVQKLHGAVSGSGDGLPDADLLALIEWIDTQVEIEWEQRGTCPYDNAVRELARVAVREAKQVMDQNAKLRELADQLIGDDLETTMSDHERP